MPGAGSGTEALLGPGRLAPSSHTQRTHGPRPTGSREAKRMAPLHGCHRHCHRHGARAGVVPPTGDGGRSTLCAEAHGNGMACLPACLEWSVRIIGSGHGIGIGKRRVQCVARPHACAMAADPTHPLAAAPSSCPCGSLVPQHSGRSHPPIHSPCPCAVRHR